MPSVTFVSCKVGGWGQYVIAYCLLITLVCKQVEVLVFLGCLWNTQQTSHESIIHTDSI